MRTSDVLQAFGGSRAAIADALDISASAVYQWDDVVPPSSAIRLAAMRPDIPYDPEIYKNWNRGGGRKRKPKRH